MTLVTVDLAGVVAAADGLVGGFMAAPVQILE
jgi:hypothetical protein